LLLTSHSQDYGEETEALGVVQQYLKTRE